MNIVIAGGTGFIGGHLVDYLLRQNHNLTLLTRSSGEKTGGAKSIRWDGRTIGSWADSIDGADAVINLAGKNIFTRWSEENKRAILASRMDSTRILVQAIKQASRKPAVFISTSAVGYYGNTGDEEVTESHAPGRDFLADVCVQWEAASHEARQFGVRVVNPRFGIVLGKDGGALQQMKLQFNLFVGGYMGSGRQFFPWVHIDDLIRSLGFLLDQPDTNGPYNITAPHSVRMKEFASTLGDVMNRPSWLPVPTFALKLALGEAAGLLIDGQRAIPAALVQRGFTFSLPTAREALQNIFTR
jgi:uncharacterized protein (TIGR01777 family)